MAMGEPHRSPADSRPKLGELLVQRNLLTRNQLDAALAEQQASGLPLGAILVRDGLVPSHTIALLLAEQSGGPLKTEFGYAVAPSTALGLRLAPQAMPEPAQVSEDVPPLREVAAVVPEAVPEPPTLEPRIRDVEAHLAAEAAARAALEHEVAALRDRLAELELRAEGLEAVRASEARSIAGRPYTSERHLLLVPVGERYELLERPGPPPEDGSVIDLFGDRSFVVVRVGPAPIPGALEACAYLEPVHSRTTEP
jgi:hypothetical protein